MTGLRADGTVASTDDQLRKAELMRHRQSRGPAPRSSFTGYHFPPDVIMLAVRWYLRYSLMPLWMSSG
jgi:transposase, IS6 family